jgi:hypothetical protein
MRILDTELEGVRLIQPVIYEDFRGTNFESYNDTKYRDEISYPFVVDSISTSRKHTLRGIHGDNKTRKLGKYVAASYQTLSVKGTTIVGFDADKSVSKTLRKPEEQLKEFAKAGKIALRTFMKEIKAVETKLNGRIGIDILLLKVN